MNANAYHTPVLCTEAIELLSIVPDGKYIDVTFGGGGHSRAILAKLGAGGKLYACDQDSDAIAIARAITDSRFEILPINFSELSAHTETIGLVNGLLADLGVSSYQLDTASRGFSFRYEAALDMRMDKRTFVTAADIIANASTDELQFIFQEYGELPFARRLADRIVKFRRHSPIQTTSELAALATERIPLRQHTSYLAQLFQALRIAVNDELGALENLLMNLPKLVAAGGRVVIISYHSLEDRLVKRFLRSGNRSGEVDRDMLGNRLVPWLVTGKQPVVPTAAEIKRNPRARSARLRYATRAYD
jgi:16S rRNA (cytosine1402-N4)-methyltransferase